MPEAATTEFWKDLKPIQDVFKPDGIPEVFYADTTSGKAAGFGHSGFYFSAKTGQYVGTPDFKDCKK